MKKSKHEMYLLVKLWLESSMIKQDFYKKHEVGNHRLNYWIKKYNKDQHPVKSSPYTGFLPLTIYKSVNRETGSEPQIGLGLSRDTITDLLRHDLRLIGPDPVLSVCTLQICEKDLML